MFTVTKPVDDDWAGRLKNTQSFRPLGIYYPLSLYTLNLNLSSTRLPQRRIRTGSTCGELAL